MSNSSQATRQCEPELDLTVHVLLRCVHISFPLRFNGNYLQTFEVYITPPLISALVDTEPNAPEYNKN